MAGVRGLLLLVLGGALGALAAWMVYAVGLTVRQADGGERLLSLGLAVLAVALPTALLLSPPVREAEVALARALLGADLPDVVTPRSWASRLKGALWAAMVIVAGGAALVAVLSLVPTGAGLVVAPWTEVSSLPSGWDSPWLVPLGLLVIIAGLVLPMLVVAGLHRATPVVLGPTVAERQMLHDRELVDLARRQALAQELHDGIGHALTAIGVQAEAAAATDDPELTARALEVIRRASVGAVADLDRALGLLRAEGAPGGPDLRDLAVLTDGVATDVEGDLAGLAPEVSRTGFRVVQEALTNAARHGEGPAHLRLRTDDELRIEVRNAIGGGRSGARRGGLGLVGLRERVRVHEGRCEAGPEGDEWVLRASLPVR